MLEPRARRAMSRTPWACLAWAAWLVATATLSTTAVAEEPGVSAAGRPDWKCEGTSPAWTLGRQGDAIQLTHGGQSIRFKSVEPEHFGGEAADRRVWVYQTQALGSRSLPLTLIIEHTGRHSECWYADGIVGDHRHFVGFVVMPTRVLVGCCQWAN
jgi:hypothetical protein